MSAVPECYCLKRSAPYWSDPPVLIFDIRALWRSVLSARVPECQKSKLVGQTSMAKCKALMGLAVKGLTRDILKFPLITILLSVEVTHWSHASSQCNTQST